MLGDISWINGLQRYVIAIARVNLVWELIHLPLYKHGDRNDERSVFAAVHCTGRDTLIGASALLFALFSP